MSLVQLQFQKESALRLRKLIDEAESTSIVSENAERVVPVGAAVVVRLESAIAAGSSDPVNAEIMSLVNGVWVGTGQLVPGGVRSATGLAVTTTGRRIARKVSTWGYCVVET